MNGHLTEERLNGFVDGTLRAAERAEAERHLAACASCRTEVAALQALLRDAAALPKSLAPPHDLWSGIEQRLSVRPSARPRVRLWELAAAALLVVGIGTAVLLRATGSVWEIAAVEGTPRAGKSLRKGEWLETDDSSRVRLRVGRIGAVQVEAGSRVRLL